MRAYPCVPCAELSCRRPFLKIQVEMKFCGPTCKNKWHQRRETRAKQAFEAVEEFRARKKRGSGMTLLSRLAADWNREDELLLKAATDRLVAKLYPEPTRISA